jgi:hypothetical protein
MKKNKKAQFSEEDFDFSLKTKGKHPHKKKAKLKPVNDKKFSKYSIYKYYEEE